MKVIILFITFINWFATQFEANIYNCYNIFKEISETYINSMNTEY